MTENDFRRYVKNMQKICSETDCKDCELYKTCHATTLMNDEEQFNPEDFIKAVDKWCAEHPTKTYVQDFFEKFPDAYRCVNGTPDPCRNYIYSRGDICSKDGECFKCWNEEMTK